MYVGGLPCLQVEDVLYSEQADPDQATLTPPPSGEVRWDTVYLDVWTEPVTYVQDPAIREVALGGPDTATRQAVRHRVRVAQDGGTPKGNGIGGGTLATEGSYTATANRLYLVEIDTAGNIGEQATFRWSGENAATIQRVIEPVPEGSIEVTVEDAAAFHKGDLLLLRTELGSERHEVASVLANVITLVTPTATAFSLSDRPMLQRWNAFQVPIPPDPADASVSRAIDLDDGVRVRFGGRDLRMGDSWSFTTRYLAGDDVSGIDPVTRIERLDFQPASGVVHHYAPLAVITRHGDGEDPDQILEVQDRRGRVGTRTAVGFLPDHEVIVREGTYHLGGLRLPTGARASKLFAFWWADMTLINPPQAGFLTVRLSFYSDEMRDPATDPDTGRIERREAMVALGEREQFNALPLYLRFAEGSPGFALPLLSPVSTSLQVFATLNLPDSGFELFLINMQVMAIERTDG
jgi:hypothetical protein